jgi:predicted nuclease with TOPRIM domain
MKKIGLFILLLFMTLIYTRCQEKKVTTTTPVENFPPSDTIQLPELKGLKPSLRLTVDASAVTTNWVLYNSLVMSLDSLNQGTISDVKKRLDALDKAFEDLEEAKEAAVDPMPSELQTNAIKARLNALETQIKALKNEALKNEPDPEKIANSITRSKNALQDLNLQINEKFSLSIEEMLEAANEIPDSLFVPQTERLQDSLNISN